MSMNKLLLGLLLCLLQGCASQSREIPALLPLPPSDSLPVITSAPSTESPESTVALQNLLIMKASVPENAVAQIRPQALRETAQMVTLQTAIAWRYGQLIQATERHAAILDKAFHFSPLLVTQGNALIMPPVLTRAGASMRIEDSHAATTSLTSYELLEEARYVSVAPHWRRFLMVDDFPKPDTPNPSVLPQNVEERTIWQEAVKEAWALGIEQADQLYTDNVARMVRDYRGIMLYHLLTAQQLLTQVQTASSDLGANISDSSKMHLGQTVYRITAPATFKVPSNTSGGLLVAAPPARAELPTVASFSAPQSSPIPVIDGTPPVVAAALPAYPTRSAPSAFSPSPLPKTEPVTPRHYGYEVIGNPSLKPVQIYDDGQKTFIRMPQTSPDSAFIARHQGGEVANYRRNGDTLVVDAVCADAVLLFGLGEKQQRVTIRRLD